VAKSNALETAILQLLFNGTTIAGLAQNVTSGAVTDLYVALHTADPGEAGTATTNEASYTSYARVAVVRTAGGWTITGNSVSPNATVNFPASTGGSATSITHASITVASSGASMILYRGALDAPIVMASGVQPKISTGSTITEE
jgi:hypothetical protein